MITQKIIGAERREEKEDRERKKQGQSKKERRTEKERKESGGKKEGKKEEVMIARTQSEARKYWTR